MSREIDIIHEEAYAYARDRGATQDEAREVANGVEKAVRRISKHVITQAGFTPERWKP